MTLPVIHFESEWVPNPNPRGETPFEVFWEVRGAVLAASQRFGETGPESKESPRYWVVEDQYNDELYQYMEVYEPEGWTTEWLLALIGVLSEHRGWGIGIKVYEGYLLVFGDRLMVNGPAFADCDDLESVASAARAATERFNERKYGLLGRQLDYIQRILPAAMRTADANTFAYVATFDRYELFEGNAIWILQTRRVNELLLRPDCGQLRECAVTADGTIHPQYCKDFFPYSNVEPPYRLRAYLSEDKAERTFKLVDEHDKSIATIRIDRIITDEELKQGLKPN